MCLVKSPQTTNIKRYIMPFIPATKKRYSLVRKVCFFLYALCYISACFTNEALTVGKCSSIRGCCYRALCLYPSLIPSLIPNIFKAVPETAKSAGKKSNTVGSISKTPKTATKTFSLSTLAAAGGFLVLSLSSQTTLAADCPGSTSVGSSGDYVSISASGGVMKPGAGGGMPENATAHDGSVDVIGDAVTIARAVKKAVDSERA